MDESLKYPIQWTAGLSGREKENLEDILSNNNLVLDRLVQICYNMIRESEETLNDYDHPNWALKVADSNGYKRALKRIIQICNRGDNPSKETMTNG